VTFSSPNQPEAANRPASRSSWLVYLTWFLAAVMTALMIYFILARTGVVGATQKVDNLPTAPDLGEAPAIVQLPVLDPTRNDPCHFARGECAYYRANPPTGGCH